MAEGAAARGAATREALMRAAIELIGEVGWGSVSTRMVAERAGVPTGSVHYHFRSLDGLLADATLPLLNGLVAEAESALDAAEGIDGGIDWITGMISHYTADASELRLSGEIFLAAARSERLGAEIAAALARFRRAVAAWLTRCGRDRDAEAVAVVIAASVDGLMLHRAVDASVDPNALADVLRTILKTDGTRRNAK
ncbi:TetR/AcrR family transcriptional regulator [Streptomyces meridianus]|uniref:TetR/AcrR family transcriptional regulator n=1 Tax=Streptomyces meridianus TaxID=2938945 RepID=A0ABT0X9E5_9ACTN|nr:TetR family transcriptional regulator [Streptomyces meridianus]MCM2579029.1 TetR/AcrR family transcriptional regulator [Streptomyces meridianus]